MSGLHGAVYVQGGTRGLASYHFERVEADGAVAAYISYESPACDVWPALEDGSRPPPRVAFRGGRFDAAARVFTGSVEWYPTRWRGDAVWHYTMVFSADYRTIEAGRVTAYARVEADGVPVAVYEYGMQLCYERMMAEHSFGA